MTKTRFLVTLDLPPKVTLKQMAAYIANEVKCGVGQMMPDEPLWNLDRDSVKVTPINGPNSTVHVVDHLPNLREIARHEKVVENYSEWLERVASLQPGPWRPVSELSEHVFVSRMAVLRRPVATDGGAWVYTTAVSTPDGWKTASGEPPHPDCEFKEIDQ